MRRGRNLRSLESRRRQRGRGVQVEDNTTDKMPQRARRLRLPGLDTQELE